jgi:hypothetical protein
VDYEAFNTSGGVGTLCETLDGRVRELDYKTIRYRGHRELMAFLMNELRLNDAGELLKDILETRVPITPQDVVLIFCTVDGWKGRPPHAVTDARKIYHLQRIATADRLSAIQLTTASSLCAVLDLHVDRARRAAGFVSRNRCSSTISWATVSVVLCSQSSQEQDVTVPGNAVEVRRAQRCMRKLDLLSRSPAIAIGKQWHAGSGALITAAPRSTGRRSATIRVCHYRTTSRCVRRRGATPSRRGAPCPAPRRGEFVRRVGDDCVSATGPRALVTLEVGKITPRRSAKCRR